MTAFPFDELRPVLLDEIKKAFVKFIDQKREDDPYIFCIVPLDWCPDIPCGFTFSVMARGNTISGFNEACRKAGERRKADAEANDDSKNLWYYYFSEEWEPSEQELPKTNDIILRYFSGINLEDISDDDCAFTEEFLKFRADLFDFLVECLVHLKQEGLFAATYDGKMLIDFQAHNFEDRYDSYYSEDAEIKIFERLNAEEDAKQHKKYVLRDRMALFDLRNASKDKASFLTYLEALINDLKNNPETLEKLRIDVFLTAIHEWVHDYHNDGIINFDHPDWKVIAAIFDMGRLLGEDW